MTAWRALLESLAGLPYGGEAVDQLAHALQCAQQAADSGADDEVVAAAALHDIGRARSVVALHPGVPHEEAGAEFCRPRFGERVAWLVGAHVAAKRYLVATEPAYRNRLSPTSVRSLAVQGGPMGAVEAEAFAAMSGAADAVLLRRWDEAAKDPGASAADLGAVVDLLDGLGR